MENIAPKEQEKIPEKNSGTGRGKRKVLDAIVYFVIFFGIILGLPKFLTWSLNTPYPMAAITSGSMWPALKEGDLVFVKGIKKEELAIDDIIVYRNKVNNTFTIHRVVKLNADTVVTKGDGNFGEDSPALYGDIMGRALTVFGKPVHIPYLGSITVFANNLRTEKEK